MPRFQLIAARDGDIYHEVAEWPDVRLAEAWASGSLALAFGLDPEEFDSLENLGPELDGLSFEQVEEDGLVEAATALVETLHPILLRDARTPLLNRDRHSIAAIARMADLASILQKMGVNGRSLAGEHSDAGV